MANVASQSVFAALLDDVVASATGTASDTRDMREIILAIPLATYNGKRGPSFNPSEAKSEIITPAIGKVLSGPKAGEYVKRYLKRESVLAVDECQVNIGKGRIVRGLAVRALAYVFTSRGIDISDAVVVGTGKVAGKAAKAAAKPVQAKKPVQAGTRHAVKLGVSETPTLSPAAAAVADIPIKDADTIAAEVAAQKAARLAGGSAS